MFLSLTIFVILFNTTRMVDSFPVDELTRRASVRISSGCTGTLVSSNLVYTAAHCLYGQNVSSLFVSHPSQPTRHYRVKYIYYPEDFGRGLVFKKNWDDNIHNCNSADCNQECVQHRVRMQRYYAYLDYGLILLADHVDVCVHPNGPVAAALRYPVLLEQEKTYVPAEEKMECFVARYRYTDDKGFDEINLGIVHRVQVFIDTSSGCGEPYRKYINARFYSPEKPRNCEGDSGAGVQCISRGGTDLSVIGIETTGTGGTKGAYEKRCLDSDRSDALATADHSWELYNKTLQWYAMTNYNAVYRKCQAFLEQHPYQSVMQEYLGRSPEFY